MKRLTDANGQEHKVPNQLYKKAIRIFKDNELARLDFPDGKYLYFRRKDNIK